jgi:hemolysin activation/secretion protein
VRGWRRHLAAIAGGLVVVTGARGQDDLQTPPPPDRPAVWQFADLLGEALPGDGPAFPVSAFTVSYVRPNDGLPSPRQVLHWHLRLGRTPQGYVAPRPNVPVVLTGLADAALRPVEQYHASAIQSILEQIRDRFTGASYIGVYVAPDPAQIDRTGRDLRAPDDTTLGIVITVGAVTEIRTLASGARIPEEQRVDNPLHAPIRDQSPVRPPRPGDPPGIDLLRKDLLDRYIFHKSRHPGRRIDASVSAAEEPGGIVLDYLVTENRPLALYAQISNTGTPQTDRIVYRAGLVHNQLTNSDDVLSFDYRTAGFDDSHAVTASYVRPFPNDRIRWRVYGDYAEYTADQVGFFGDEFLGESWTVGADISANIYQDRELFVDLVGGFRVQYVEVDDRATLVNGQEHFAIPYVGLTLDRTTEWFSTLGQVTMQWQVGSTDEDEVAALGRTLPDDDWTVLQWFFHHSTFLEPWLDRAAWEDPTTPESSTLAHELTLSCRGQYAFGDRLIPQAESVIGGLYSVRGYPESVVAGDSVVVGSIEYRLHLPRTFSVQAEPREIFGEPFRVAPQFVYGRPDWDLVLKGFLDVGHADISDSLFFEDDHTLVGVGVGVELYYRRNLNARLDWGFALRELEEAGVSEGANRVHFVVTWLF